MPLLPPPISAGNRERLQVPYFRNSTHLDPQVGSTRNLGVRHKDQMVSIATNGANTLAS
jgi:hypothetical protein